MFYGCDRHGWKGRESREKAVAVSLEELGQSTIHIAAFSVEPVRLALREIMIFGGILIDVVKTREGVMLMIAGGNEMNASVDGELG